MRFESLKALLVLGFTSTGESMKKSDWVTGTVLCEELGFSIDHLSRLRQEGLLKEGKHYRNVGRPRSRRPTYRYHLKRCELALEVPPELR